MKPTIEELAKKFSEVLRAHLGYEEMTELIIKNANEDDPVICHSHDFIDANMVMLEAFESFGIPEAKIFIDLQWLWNEAWELAKKNNFYN